MGSTFTKDLIEQGALDLNSMLRIHLQNNHYPPVHEAFIPNALEAIEQCNEDSPETIITMCNGIEKTAEAIVDGLHLHDFLDQNQGE